MTGKSQAYDGFTTPGVSALSTNVDMTFLWAPANTTPDIVGYTGLASTPANGVNGYGRSHFSFWDWTKILDGQFTLATNSSTGFLATQRTLANGAITYNGGANFPVTGTTGNTTYTIYMISWDAQYATPEIAAANNSALGWSTPFQYTSGLNVASSLPTMSGVVASFGTFFLDVTPEPTTLALAVVGGLSLLACRRK